MNTHTFTQGNPAEPPHVAPVGHLNHPELAGFPLTTLANGRVVGEFFNAWSDAITERIRLSGRDAVLVAHSFGCLAAVRAARTLGGRVRAALLAAPADPKLFGVSQRLPFAFAI